MNSLRLRDRLRHMLAAAREILEFVEGLDREAFMADRRSGVDYARLEAAGQLETIETKSVDVARGRLDLTTVLPRQGVSLIRLEW